MKIIELLHSIQSALCSLIFIIVLFSASIVLADIQGDAAFAVAKLHQMGASRNLPDEMVSLDATLADAQQLIKLNDRTKAEKLYLLVLQKAHVIESLLDIPQTPLSTLDEPNNDSIDLQTDQLPLSPMATEPEPEIPSNDTFSTKLIGGSGIYTVVSGDTIRLVAAKLGVTRQHLIKSNNLDPTSFLKIGQKLSYNNLKIIPKRLREGIVVNIPDRTLYFFKNSNLVKSIPVALGVPTKNERYIWQTPVGKFKIVSKQKDPTWHVPPSIQSEMEERGQEVVISIPPGPANPLGKFAIKTSLPGILIHSTTKPWSIYSFASHGCIRVYPAHMEDFFNEVRINTLGEIIYKPVKLAVTETGKIFLEVHNDIYKKGTNIADEAKKLIEKQNLTGKVNWKKFDTVTKQKNGIAEDITL